MCCASYGGVKNAEYVGVAEDFSLDGLRILAKVVNVYDGDTLRVKVKLHKLVQYSCRLIGIDAPEMKPKKKDYTHGGVYDEEGRNEEKAAAVQSRDALIDMIGDAVVWAVFGKMDKYGRPLVTLYTRRGFRGRKNGMNVNQWMLENAYAVPYDGGTKSKYVNDHVISDGGIYIH